MKLHIKFTREVGLCFAAATLENGDSVSACGNDWDEAERRLIEKVRIETGYIDNIPPDKEIEIQGEETGSLFGKEADVQFEHTPEDYRIAIPPPEPKPQPQTETEPQHDESIRPKQEQLP